MMASKNIDAVEETSEPAKALISISEMKALAKGREHNQEGRDRVELKQGN